MATDERQFDDGLLQKQEAVRESQIAARPKAAHLPDAVLSALGIFIVLAAWVGITSSGLLRPGYFPGPLELYRELVLLLKDGYKDSSLWAHIGISLMRTGVGFTLGVLVGVPLGLLTGISRVSGAMISPIMAFLRPIPPIAFIPIAVLYFGLGEAGKIALIFWTSFNYVYVNAQAGAAHVPIAYLRAAHSLGLTQSQLFFRVVLPAAIPQIFTGLKVAMALSWAVVVAAELTGAQSGLGYMIEDAALTFRIPVVFLGIGIIGVIGLFLNAALNFAEAHFVHWKGR